MATQDLQAWISAHSAVEGSEYYRKPAINQAMAVRDVIAPRIGSKASVIAEHRSKSVQLPVYSIDREDIGLRFVLRNNFYNWKMSVISREPIEADFGDLFHTTPPVEPEYTGNPLSPVYFEGFPRELCFGYYEQDRAKFSAEIWGGDCRLYAAVFLIMQARGAIQPLRWRTRESHRIELEVESKKLRAELETERNRT